VKGQLCKYLYDIKDWKIFFVLLAVKTCVTVKKNTYKCWQYAHIVHFSIYSVCAIKNIPTIVQIGVLLLV